MAQLFCESQKFNQWWLWAIMLLVLFVSIAAGINDYELTEDPTGLLIGGGVGVLIAILFASLTLRTEVTEDGIAVRFGPFGGKKIFRSEIERAYVREYSPVREYGGWGVRWGPKGMAYNVSGKHGLQLELKNGKRILIGTQRPEELAAAVEGYVDEATIVGDEELILDEERLVTQKERLRDTRNRS